MTAQYLIGYDIAHPRRLIRLHRRLQGYGVPIQYSLFLCSLTEARRAACIAMIGEIINPREDDVRLYPLPVGFWSIRMGRAVLPAGILHTGMPSSWQAREGVTASPAKSKSAATSIRTKSPDRPDATARKMIATRQTGQKKGILFIP